MHHPVIPLSVEASIAKVKNAQNLNRLIYENYTFKVQMLWNAKMTIFQGKAAYIRPAPIYSQDPCALEYPSVYVFPFQKASTGSELSLQAKC
ncbi:hypothetical protein GOBAR_DD23483 [Gossypium barbadense]|nr:hypothetical protein GOBAR_DD23483 [Gossypium barbadense]